MKTIDIQKLKNEIEALKKENETLRLNQKSEIDIMVDTIMNTYDSLSEGNKRRLANYVYMIAFCEKHSRQFERFKLGI